MVCGLYHNHYYCFRVCLSVITFLAKVTDNSSLMASASGIPGRGQVLTLYFDILTQFLIALSSKPSAMVVTKCHSNSHSELDTSGTTSLIHFITGSTLLQCHNCSRSGRGDSCACDFHFYSHDDPNPSKLFRYDNRNAKPFTVEQFQVPNEE